MIENFDKYKKVHFIGIGGVGISAIARMFLADGKEVTGSDAHESHVTESLQGLGIKVKIGQDKNNLESGTDLVVYTIAISEDNEEMVRAKELGIEMISYPETLAVISKNKKTIAITGTHGKTTTTSMTAKALQGTGINPTTIVGTILKEWKSNFLKGDSGYFLVEGCEYKRSFLNLHPFVLVITNIEADHLDYYKDLEDIKSAFRELAVRVPEDGFVIAPLKDENVKDVLEGVRANLIDYTETDLGDFKIESMPGEHNLQNAKVAVSVAKALGGDEALAKSSLKDFSGVWRRFDFIGQTSNGALVYDDYAHHPTEIKSFLGGVKEKFNDKKIIAVFGPHMLSRTKDFLEDFAKSFSGVDKVFILPIYKARNENVEGISSADLVGLINENGVTAEEVKDFDDAKNKILDLLDNNTVLLRIGAGETNKLAEEKIK